MSGSPVKIVDKDWLEDNLTADMKKKGKKKKTIGIHTGHDDTVMLNYGTLITNTLYDWIYNGKGLDVKKDVKTKSKKSN